LTIPQPFSALSAWPSLLFAELANYCSANLSSSRVAMCQCADGSKNILTSVVTEKQEPMSQKSAPYQRHPNKGKAVDFSAASELPAPISQPPAQCRSKRRGHESWRLVARMSMPSS